MSIKSLLFVVFFLFSGPCWSEPASKESIEKMFTLIDMDKMLDSMYAQMDTIFGQMADEFDVDENKKPTMDKFFAQYTELLREEISWQKMKQPIIDVYAEVFTEEEVSELIKFYETPVGQKMLQKMPELMQASMSITKDLMIDFIPKLEALKQEIKAELNAELE